MNAPHDKERLGIEAFCNRIGGRSLPSASGETFDDLNPADAREIQAGTVKINRTTTGNLVNAPFGGLKRSSSASFRESGRVGLEFHTQLRTVYQGV